MMALYTPLFIRQRFATCLQVVGLILSLSLTSCNEQEEDLVSESEIGQWQYLTSTQGLGSNHVNVIFEDSRGRMWVGTTFGLSVISDNSILTYTSIDGLLDNNIFAISEDREGVIWIGTRQGINIFREDEEQWYYYTFWAGKPVYALIDLQNEQGMLIGTGSFGIYHYNYATPGFAPFDEVEGCEACNAINSMFQAEDGSIWIASFAGARRIRGNFITQFDASDGLAGNIATTIAEDSWGNIWVGTVEGKTISKIQGNNVSQVSFNNGADQNFIFGIQEDNKGGLWVGTVGNGLFYYDGAIMKQVYDGAPDFTITALFKDSRGNIWIGTSEEGLAIYITNPVP